MQWNFNRNSYVFIHENAFENVACEMAGILSRPRCVNSGKDICTVTWYILEDQIYKVAQSYHTAQRSLVNIDPCIALLPVRLKIIT